MFTEDGGTIGRGHQRLGADAQQGLRPSRQHHLPSGVFYIQDASRNGVSINSPDNRLARSALRAEVGRPHLHRAHEIDVSIDAGVERPRYQPLDDPFGQDDPFAPVRGPQPERLSPVPPAAGDEVDPLKFFEAVNPTAPRQPAEPPGQSPGR